MKRNKLPVHHTTRMNFKIIALNDMAHPITILFPLYKILFNANRPGGPKSRAEAACGQEWERDNGSVAQRKSGRPGALHWTGALFLGADTPIKNH